jgi:hypothetical protein
VREYNLFFTAKDAKEREGFLPRRREEREASGFFVSFAPFAVHSNKFQAA